MRKRLPRPRLPAPPERCDCRADGRLRGRGGGLGRAGGGIEAAVDDVGWFNTRQLVAGQQPLESDGGAGVSISVIRDLAARVREWLLAVESSVTLRRRPSIA